MAVTWSKTTVTENNPFDDVSETVIEVNSVACTDGSLPFLHYTFANGTTDATIQSTVEADLTDRGYTL